MALMQRRISLGMVMLLLAALALVAAVAVTVLRADAPPPAAPVAAEAGSDSELAALEARAKAEPDSAAVWQLLGTARFDRSLFSESADAYGRATKLAPKQAVLWSSLGEALVMASKREPMPAGALAAFQKANALDAKDPRARYFLAVKRDIDGDHQGAIDDWFALLADTPAGAPWESDLRRTIEQVGKINKLDVAARLAAATPKPMAASEMPVAARAIPGPSRQQMQDAAALPKGQQDAMIADMVGGLEAKLAANPANVDGWIMLLRSRMTLGESAKAADALKRAVAANPAAEVRLRGQAKLLGVPGA